MKVLMSAVIGVVSLLVLGLMVLAGLGSRMPRTLRVQSSAHYAAGADSAFAALADLAHAASWRSDLTGTRRLADQDGHAVWQLEARDGAWALEVRDRLPDTLLVLATPDTTRGYGGIWTFRVEPESTGCRVRITEVNTIEPLMARFVARCFGDPRAAQQTFLRDLGRRLGEAAPEEAR